MLTPAYTKQYTLGELLDTSIRIYRSAFVTFVLIAALVVLPIMLLAIAYIAVSSALAGDAATLDSGAEIFQDLGPLLALAGNWASGQRRPSGLEQLLSFLALPIMQGALMYGASRRMAGQTIEVWPAYRAALNRAWPLIGARLLTTLLILVSLVPLLCFGIVAGGFLVQSAMEQAMSAAPSTGVTTIVVVVVATIVLFLPLLLFISTRLAMSQPAAMLEQHGPWSSIKHSWRLTAGSFWRVLGYVVAISLLGSVIAIVIPLTLTLPLGLLLEASPRLTNVVDAVADALASIIVAPFSAIAYTLLFYDLRTRGTPLVGAEAWAEASSAPTVSPPAP